VQILDGVLVTGICHAPCVMCRGAHTFSLLRTHGPPHPHMHTCARPCTLIQTSIGC
jgi:hypothetical protein